MFSVSRINNRVRVRMRVRNGVRPSRKNINSVLITLLWKLFRNIVIPRIFHSRLIGCSRQVPWPPRFLDITPYDLLMWGYVKDCVYHAPRTNLMEVKLSITVAIQSIIPQMLANTWNDIEYHFNILFVTKGSHIY